MNMMNEKEIITHVTNGDGDKYSYLVDRYHVGLIIHCENIVHNREDAEDLAQEAFIRAYERLATFDPQKARFSTWLYRIATNLTLDYLRKHKKRPVSIQDAEKLADQTEPIDSSRMSKRPFKMPSMRLSHQSIVKLSATFIGAVKAMSK
jgi:RNA polymerase sigma factor (sigma-70 family)